MTYYADSIIMNVALFNAVKLCSTYKMLEEKMSKEEKSTTKEQEPFEKTVLITQKDQERLVICEVCGYANPEKTAICKMCSNYLKGIK